MKESQDEIRDEVLDYFGRQGIQKVSLEDRTLYLRREVWAAKAEDTTDPAEIVKKLHELGMAELAPHKIAWQSLSAWVRERETAGEAPIPPELSGLLRMSELFKIGSRASAA